MLSSADGYCSIVVFDMSELGAVHATQQHNRQLAAIAQSHSHSHPHSHPHTVASTPTPHSPAISTTGTFGNTRQSPALSRTDREGSTASSITTNTNTNYPSQSTSIPLFCPPGSVTGRASSTTSSVDPVLPTPGEESEGFTFPKLAFASGSESGQSTQSTSVTGGGVGGGGEGGKRAESDKEGGEAPKKKRRVMLSKVADE